VRPGKTREGSRCGQPAAAAVVKAHPRPEGFCAGGGNVTKVRDSVFCRKWQRAACRLPEAVIPGSEPHRTVSAAVVEGLECQPGVSSLVYIAIRPWTGVGSSSRQVRSLVPDIACLSEQQADGPRWMRGRIGTGEKKACVVGIEVALDPVPCGVSQVAQVCV